MLDVDQETTARLRELAGLITDARGARDAQELASSVRLHRNVWGRAERGLNVAPKSRNKIESALGWAQGSIRRFLETGEPPHFADPHMDAYRGRAEDAILASTLYTDDEKRVLVATLRALRGPGHNPERRRSASE